MKKEEISGYIVYLLIVGLAVVFCFTVLRNNSGATGQPLGFWGYWGFIVGAVLSGLLVNAILFELAHIAGAKAGKYKILSVNILGFSFARNEDDKFKFQFPKGFDGFTGETKILPLYNDENKQSNPRPYLLFGSLFYAVEIIGLVTAFMFLSNKENNFFLINLGYFLLTMGVVGGVILLYNIIPMRLDSKTDGYQLTLLSNPKNKVAFNELLRVQHEIELGNTDVEIKTFDVITNFTADLNMNKVYALLDKREFSQAEELLDIILSNEKDVSYKVYLRARAQKIYIQLIQLSNEEIKEKYKDNLDIHIVREISKDVSMPSIRTYILISGLVDRSHSETVLSLSLVASAFKRVPKNRRDIEAELFNEALDKVINAHPDWEELPDYRIVVKQKEEKKGD